MNKDSGPFEPALKTSWLEVGAVVLVIAGIGLYDGYRRLRRLLWR